MDFVSIIYFEESRHSAKKGKTAIDYKYGLAKAKCYFYF
jgi:hypothetical protein